MRRLKLPRFRPALAAAVAAVALLGAAPPAAEPRPKAAGEMPLVLTDDFERTTPGGDWRFTDPKAWKINKIGGKGVLDQFQASKYEPPVRSPFNLALTETVDVSDFVLDLKVRSTGRDYGHRDVCLAFGYQDPSHFYYVHLGKEADEHANSIFLVNGKPRVSIAATRTKGTPWTDGWHHVRIVRTVKTGRVEVYFDDMETPAMTASDKTFDHGKLGVGTFDDTGQFDAVQVWGKAVKASF